MQTFFSVSMSVFIFYLIKSTIFLDLSTAQLSSQTALFSILSDMRTAVHRERYHRLVPHFDKWRRFIFHQANSIQFS